MNENAIDSLAESVWMRVMAWDDHSDIAGHVECAESDPDDCGLYREIRDSIVLWANAQVIA